jgi:hypothetical protein
MSKRFPITKRIIEAIPPHDTDSPSRGTEYSNAECIGLKLRVFRGGVLSPGRLWGGASSLERVSGPFERVV